MDKTHIVNIALRFLGGLLRIAAKREVNDALLYVLFDRTVHSSCLL